MSYPPNSPELALRSPQHGIMTMRPFSLSTCSVPYAPTPPNSPSTSTYSSCGSSDTSTAPTTPSGRPAAKVVPKDAITVHCAQQGCANMVDIVPFGEHGHGQMYVKVKCDECQIPMIVVETLKREKEEKEEREWEEEIYEEGVDAEWGEEW